MSGIPLEEFMGENRDIMLASLLRNLKAVGKPLPVVTEDRTGPRGRPWHRLTWTGQPDLVVKIDNRGIWLLTDGGPFPVRTSVVLARIVNAS